MTQYQCNFKLEDSEDRALVKCPSCYKENYAACVLSGVCAWCGFDINVKTIEYNNESA